MKPNPQIEQEIDQYDRSNSIQSDNFQRIKMPVERMKISFEDNNISEEKSRKHQQNQLERYENQDSEGTSSWSRPRYENRDSGGTSSWSRPRYENRDREGRSSMSRPRYDNRDSEGRSSMSRPRYDNRDSEGTSSWSRPRYDNRDSEGTSSWSRPPRYSSEGKSRYGYKPNQNWKNREIPRYNSDKLFYPAKGNEILFGVSPCLLALKANRRAVFKAYVRKGLLDAEYSRPKFDEILTELKKNGIEIIELYRSTMNTMTKLRPHQGICLEVSKLDYTPFIQLSNTVGNKITHDLEHQSVEAPFLMDQEISRNMTLPQEQENHISEISPQTVEVTDDEAPVYQEQGIGIPDDGTPVHQEQRIGIPDDGTPIHQEQMIGIPDHGTPVHQEQRIGIPDNGTPVHQEQGIEIPEIGKPIFHDSDSAMLPVTGEQLIKVSRSKTPVWLALDHVIDPMNLGAVLRSSYFLGADGIIVSKRNSCSLTPVVSKASSGVMEVQPVYAVDDLSTFLQSLIGWEIVGSSKSTPFSNDDNTIDSEDVTIQKEGEDIDMQKPVILVVGSEGFGLKEEVISCCNKLLTIQPGQELHPGIDSLNLSVATGILLHLLLSKKSLQQKVE
ncbi:uncharacterized protein [Antedon mediterranea]|uniref:uncharacterized protein n=1 Tax=Antedon mediterranea TaxID=105859 RepID=UPI003AF6BD2E